MAKTNPQTFLTLFNFFAWLVSRVCRVTTSVFSPPNNSPAYYQTFFDLHVGTVTYVFSIALVIISVIFAVISATTGEFVALLVGLVTVAFSISLTYGSSKRKAAYYLPALVFFHAFLYVGLVFVTLRMIKLIWDLNRFEKLGWTSSPETMIRNLAKVFYCQLKIAFLIIFGKLVNIIFRDYMFIKHASKPAAIESTPTPNTIAKELETKEQHDASSIPNLYI